MANDEMKLDVKWAIALLILSMLAFSAALGTGHAPPNDWWTAYDAYPENGDENVTALTGQFLTGAQDARFAGEQGVLRSGMPLVAPFEILSVVLLAALVGALAVAVRDPEPGEGKGGMR